MGDRQGNEAAGGEVVQPPPHVQEAGDVEEEGAHEFAESETAVDESGEDEATDVPDGRQQEPPLIHRHLLEICSNVKIYKEEFETHVDITIRLPSRSRCDPQQPVTVREGTLSFPPERDPTPRSQASVNGNVNQSQSTHYSNRFPRSNPARYIVCYHCGISGHVWANCNRLRSRRINRGRGNGRQNNTIQCFHGSGPHYRRNCPQVARTAPHNRQPANNNNTSNTQRRVEFQSTDGGASAGGQNNRSADQNRYLEDVRATHRLNNTSIRSVRNEFHSPAPTALEEQDNDSW
jgi:hypothetical protein